jgi:hypothetical protein
VQAIFDKRCTLCHDAAKKGIPADPSLPLTSDKSYATLVGKPAHEACGGTLVVPGDPDQSYLIRKLSDDMPCSGSRMPRAYEVGPAVYLTDAQLMTVRSWIAAGAHP